MWDAEFEERMCDTECGPKGGEWVLNLVRNELVCRLPEGTISQIENIESNEGE